MRRGRWVWGRSVMAGMRGWSRVSNAETSGSVTEWVISRAVMCRFWMGMSQRSMRSWLVGRG